jgi:PAS domain S-box-containing protein
VTDLLDRDDLPEDLRRQIEQMMDDHAQAKAAWEASEARLRGILDHSPTIIYLKDLTGRYIHINRRYEELLGRPVADVRGKRAEDIFPPEAAQVYAEHDDRVLRTGKPIEVEETLPLAGDDAQLVSVQFPLFDGSGEPMAICGISLDISDRVRAQRALAYRERHYKQILDNVNQGVVLHGPDGTFLYLNPAAQTILGVGDDELLGVQAPQADWVIIDEGGRRLAPDEYPIARSLREGTAVRGEVIGLGDGTTRPVRWITVDCVPVAADDGRIRAVVVSFFDSTEQVEGRARLARSEALHRSLVAHLPDVVSVISEDMTLEYLNRNAAGQPPDSLVGMDASQLIVPEHRNRFAAALQGALATGMVHDLEYSSMSGLEWHGRIVPLNQEDGANRVLVISQDITERRRSARALQTSEERFRSLIEHTAEIVFRINPEGRFTFISPAVQRLMGYEPAELVGRSFEEVLEGTEARAQATGALRNWLAGRTDNVGLTMELMVRRKDDDPFVAEITTTPIFDSDGNPFEVQGLVRDITARRRAEEALRESEAEIQHAQRLESLSVLAGGVAHDFNNLLMGVIGNADLAAGLLPEDSPVRPLLDSMLRAALTASDLSRQMLAFSGHGRFMAQPLDLGEHLASIQALLESSVPRRGVVTVALPEEVPAVHADPTQITQIALNLVMNGVEALGDDVGEVRIECGYEEVDEATLERAYPVEYELGPGRYVYLRVTDNGHGMSPDEQQRAVEPFYTTRFAGRGLGLAVALGLVRAHRGALIVESEPGAGTTATVLLPPQDGAMREEASPEAPEATASQAPPSMGTILVADDEQFVLDVADMALSQSGYTVLKAADGMEAVECVEGAAEPVSLVVLDMTMPRLTGEEALRRIRRTLPEVPVIVSTGFSESEATDRFAGLSIQGFLQKPYRPSHLIGMVGDLLGE